MPVTIWLMRMNVRTEPKTYANDAPPRTGSSSAPWTTPRQPVRSSSQSPTLRIAPGMVGSSFQDLGRRPRTGPRGRGGPAPCPVSYTHLRAHETAEHLVCRLLLEKKKKRGH